MIYTGFWRRVLAYLLDFIFISVVSLIFSLIFLLIVLFSVDEIILSDVALNLIGGGILDVIISFIIGWIYFSSMESSPTQGTLGKMALGIIVTDSFGSRIDFWQATGRYFGKILSTLLLGIGFIMVAFTSKKQGLHDMMADCLVIDKSSANVAKQTESPNKQIKSIDRVELQRRLYRRR